MTAEELNLDLFSKMSEEMREFQEWLKSQPVEEVIRHSYEYAVKADILAGLESFNLSEERTRALLSVAKPLEDIYKAYDDQGLTLIDLMMETVENYADEVIEQCSDNAEVGIYAQSEKYADEHGEWEWYQSSLHLNIQCRESIESAIAKYYNYHKLDPEAVKQTVAQFGVARVRFVLLNTLHARTEDCRIQPEYAEWAKGKPLFLDRDDSGKNNREAYVIHSHPGLINAFLHELQKEHPIPGFPVVKNSVQDKLKVKPKKIRRNFRRISSDDHER